MPNQKGTDAALAAKVAAGMQKHFATATQLLIAGSTVTPAQAIAELQSLVTVRADVDAARAALKTKLEVERTKAPALKGFLRDTVSFVRSSFGRTPDVLADFGLAPKKTRKPLTTEQKAVAKAKGEATRAARGTKGKKEKLSIRGNVTGVLVTPITAAPSPTPAAAANGASIVPSANSATNGTSAPNAPPPNGAGH